MVEETMVKEDFESRRSFTGADEETEYFIGTPSAEDIRGADWQYSKVYTKCLTEGIPTSAELMDILRRRGVIGDDFDRRAQELSITLNELITRLNDTEGYNDKAALAVEVSQAREALFQWNQRLSGPMSNTCEQIADDARLEYLTASILQNKDETKVWEDHDKFLASKDQSLTLKSRYEVMLFLQGYESNFLENTPEARAMKEVETSILQEAAAAVEKETAQQAEEDAALAEKEKPKTKPKAKPKAKAKAKAKTKPAEKK